MQTAVSHQLLKQQLASGRSARLLVTSNSMAPLIQARDKVVIGWKPVERLCRGDIITVTHEGTLLTHRLLGIQDRQLTLRGDRTTAVVEVVQVEAYVGVVTALQKRGQTVEIDHGYGRWLSQLQYLLTRWAQFLSNGR